MVVDESVQVFSDGDGEPRYYRKGILRPRLMNAADYVFYLRRHLAAERRKNDPNVGFPGDENLSMGIPRLSFLLRRLEEDIQASYLSFLEEFSSEVHDGIGCLLNLLRTCHPRQKTSASVFPYATCGRGKQSLVNKGTIDEFYCLLCLKAASRSSEAVGKMSNHKTGLCSVASCIMSAHIRSRVIAIELLTIVCKCPDTGVQRVQEAMTSVRIIFGESVRFKFLISMLHSNLGNNGTLESAILAFLNTLLDQTTKLADRVRIQSELDEAGLEIQQLEHDLRRKYGGSHYRLWAEIDKWRELQVDLQNVVQKHHENMKLKKEVHLLRNALKKLQEERAGILTIHKELRGQWLNMEHKIKSLAMKTRAMQSSTDDDPDSGGDSIPASDSSGFDCDYNSTKIAIPGIITTADSHDSELDEILIDIPTIKPGSIFEVQKDKNLYRKSSNRTTGLPYIRDVPPPLPPNHPKMSDSGISSAPESDPDQHLEWNYPDIHGMRLEKRNSSVRVRFSESTKPKIPLLNKDSPVVLPPGKNKTKYADIIGVNHNPNKKESDGAKKFFTSGFGTGKFKKKDKSLKNNTLVRSMSSKKPSTKIWNRGSSKNEVKATTPTGSSLNGMIHREIAKAIMERNALFDE